MSPRRVLYSFLLYLLFPVVIARLLWKSKSNPAYRQRLSERLGFIPFKATKPVIWVHAVSVGETNAAKPLIDGLIAAYPEYLILVTSTTPTGAQRVQDLFGKQVAHCYFPYDLPDVVDRFLKRIKPQVLIVVETEIWPNLFASCKQSNIPIGLVNARLSEKSTSAYLKINRLIKETLSNIDLIAVRSQTDADSFTTLGANQHQIKVVGNIKFDIKPNQQLIKKGKQWKQNWGQQRKVLVAASTHQGEDEIILDLYNSLLITHPGLILVLVPRHPERFDHVYELCKTYAGKDQKVIRHSESDQYQGKPEVAIIVGDSMGEMQSWFAAADVVLMGGSLLNIGGHNPIEAIVQGKPVVSGKYMFNFRDIVPELEASGMLSVCDTVDELKREMTALLSSEERALFMEKGQQIMNKHKGATRRLLKEIADLV